MKILLVAEYYIPHIGGVEVLFSNIAKRMADLCHATSVVTARLPGTRKEETIEGVKVFRVKVPSRAGRYWFTVLSIPEILKRAKEADFIHSTTWTGAFPAWLVARLRGKRCVITVHEVNTPVWQYLGKKGPVLWLHKLYEKTLFKLPFYKYIAVSKYTKDCLTKYFNIPARKIDVIYNGIDYDCFDPTKASDSLVRKKLELDSEFVYMYYGRPGFTKGVEYLIQAVPLISKRILNSKLLLILANDPKDRYENIKKMIADLYIENEIMLLDPVPRNELPDYIAASDCVVVPSLSEGFGFTAAEACAMGKPVVASNVASLPEVVSGRYVLVEPRNPEAIAEGVEKVYKGEVGSSEQKVFSWDKCVDGYFKVYEDVMASE